MSVDITAAFGEAAVTELSQKKAEPKWLEELRLSALRAYGALPVPDWRRTKVGQVDINGIQLYKESSVATGDAAALPEKVRSLVTEADGAIVLQIDSTLAYRHLPAELAGKGIIFTSLDQAVKEHEALVREHLFTSVATDAHRLIALHASLHSGGAFIYVPKNVRVELPLQCGVWSEADGLGLFPHLLVVADEGAEVTVLERYVSGAGRLIVSQVTEVIAKANAEVTVASIQSWGEGTTSLVERRGVVDRDATLNWVLGELGSAQNRTLTHTRLEGDGSQSAASMVIFADQTQEVDAGLVMNHVGHYTSSDMVTKTVLKDKAYAVYRALTDIEDGAINTSGFQVENALILNKGARLAAIPELEIEETEVQAGHAATVGQVDETLLFYMMSRGVPRAEAIRLIVEGFLDPLLSRIPLESVRGELEKLIDRKMNR